MDTKQITYILKIAEEGSVSRAAEKLYITQSALNQQLLKLERELGLNLFNRVSHNMVPTYAGQVYLDAAQKIVQIKDETYKIMGDIAGSKRGEISIAYTPERGSTMFAEIYPAFYKLYPEMKFKIQEARAKKMEQLLEKKAVNIAFMANVTRRPQFDYHVMQTELVVLGVPQTHPLAHLAGNRSWKHFPSIDLTLFRDDYFVLMSQETLIRDLIDQIFDAAGFAPNVLFETTSTHTAFNVVRNQVCPAFFSQSFVNPEAPMVYFSTTPPLSWNNVAVTRKDAYLSKAEQELIRLASEYYGSVYE